MTAQPAPLPNFRNWDNNGLPLFSGKLYTYQAGTSNPQQSYTDSTQSTPNANPVILNSRGEASVWLDPTLIYKLVLQDSLGNTLWTKDQIPGGYVPVALLSTYVTATFIGQQIYPQIGAESAAGINSISYAYNPFGYDVRRAGVVPNVNTPTVAAANYAALVKLFAPQVTNVTGPMPAGPVGRFYFPNVSGQDVYYIGVSGSTCVIPVRDGCRIDLMGSTLQFAGTGTSADSNSGMFFALHDFVLENGNINVNWATGPSTSSGSAIQIGARPSGSSYFQVADAAMVAGGGNPLGNITLRNLRLSINVTGAGLSSAGGISMTGGIQGLIIQNVYINGNGTLTQPINYEFGFATTAVPVQSSHLHEALISNVHINNCDTSVGTAMILTGVCNLTIDGFYFTGIANGIGITPGEATNFNPWTAVDTGVVKHNIAIRNVVGKSFTNIGINIQGIVKNVNGNGYLAWKASTGFSAGQIVMQDPNMYTCATSGTSAASGGPTGTGSGIVDGTVTWNWLASAYPAAGGAANSAWPNESDLYEAVLDNIVLDGGANTSTTGIFNNGCAKLFVRSATITNCGSGIVAGQESVSQVYDGVTVLNSQKAGIAFDQGGTAIWSPTRLKKIEVRNCYVAGSSRSGAGSYSGIEVDASTDSMLVENCRFGYSIQHAGVTESTQAGGVLVTGNASNVICRANWCAPPVGGGSASYYSLASVSNGCTIQNATGDTSFHGPWDGVEMQATVALTCTTPGNLAVAYSSQLLTYIKTGNRIDWVMRLEASSFTWTTASGAISITGLPYTVNSSAGISQASLSFQGITKASYTQFNVVPNPGTTALIVQASASGQGVSSVLISDLPTGGSPVFRASGSYFL